MLVMGLRRYGLVTCITRFISFKPLTLEIKKVWDACINVNTVVIYNTRPCNSTAKIFDFLVDEYGKNGYPGEWELHH